MEFKQFADKVHTKYNELSKSDTLYKVNSPKEDLWSIYLGSYTGKDAEIFRERPHHDCQTCKSFINRLGSVVAVTENGYDSIWNVEGLEGSYKVVAENMHNFVCSHNISGLFYINESLAGKEYNIEETQSGNIKWEHFYANISSKFIKQDIATINSEIESTVSVFNRALNEFSINTLETVEDLCVSIYRGEEFLLTVSKFKDAKIKYELLDEKGKKDFIWTEFRKYPSKIRNSAIGSLIVDIEEGKDIESAVKSFETKVAPQNYKRTSEIITPNMVKEAQKLIDELGIEKSLYRRFATIEDISVNDVIYVDRNSKSKMKDSSVQSILMQAVSPPKTKSNNITEIKIDDFLNLIKSNVEKIEILPENKHLNNLCSIIAPKYSDAPNILKWNNNYSWAYKGGFTDSIKENVKNAGGKVDGLLRFSIQWNDLNDNENDLDAHCTSPLSHIYYGSKDGRCGGQLDVDIINPNRKLAVENIIWQNLPPKGKYEFKVVNFSDRGGSNFKAQIEFAGQIFDYEVNGKIKKDYPVATVTHDGNGNFTIVHHLESSQSSKIVDGVISQDYNTVSSIMLSPNHWGENNIGNKHYMFLIEGARNDEKIRGLYNEFLSNDLMKHRKTFDVLGSKLLCEEVDVQLTGLGFSSTIRNDVVVRVTSSDSKRLFKIIF